MAFTIMEHELRNLMNQSQTILAQARNKERRDVVQELQQNNLRVQNLLEKADVCAFIQ